MNLRWISPPHRMMTKHLCNGLQQKILYTYFYHQVATKNLFYLMTTKASLPRNGWYKVWKGPLEKKKPQHLSPAINHARFNFVLAAMLSLRHQSKLGRFFQHLLLYLITIEDNGAFIRSRLSDKKLCLSLIMRRVSRACHRCTHRFFLCACVCVIPPLFSRSSNITH